MRLCEMEFRVIWEVLVHADGPEQAAEQARALQLNSAMPATLFSVWDYHHLKMHRVDVDEPPNQLDNGALATVRTALRRLQCARHLEPGIKDLVSVMLIFLDEEDGKLRNGGCSRIYPRDESFHSRFDHLSDKNGHL
jgi:hypothetical protein